MPVPDGQSPVSCLQEYCASRGLMPRYDDLGTEGPALTRVVMVTVGDVDAIGKGPCKEAATQDAAQVALNSLHRAQDSQPGDGVERPVKMEPGEREDWGPSLEVQQLLMNKFVMILGDSNHRAVYKDLVLLLQKNDLLTSAELRAKGELTFHNDRLVTGGMKGRLNNSVSYTEEREYATDSHLVKFFFITRCYNPYVESILQQISTGRAPDLLIMNSCLWDLTRYGPFPLQEYRVRLEGLCGRLGEVLTPHTLFLWTTTFPLAKRPRGGVLTPEVVMQNRLLTLEVMQANCEARAVLVRHGLNVVDMQYWLRNKLDLRASDGVHWCGSAHRFISQVLLSTVTHLWGLSRPSFSDLRYPIMPNELHAPLLNDPPRHHNHQLFGRLAAPYRRPVPYHVPVAHPVFQFGSGRQVWEGSHGNRTLPPSPLCQRELEGLTRLAASFVTDNGSASQRSETRHKTRLKREGRGLSVLKNVNANVPLADQLCSEGSTFPAPPGCKFDPTPSTPTSKLSLAKNVPSWPEKVPGEKSPVSGENTAGLQSSTGEGVPDSDPGLSDASLATCKPAAGESSASSESWSQRSLDVKCDSQTAATSEPCSPSEKNAAKPDSQSAALSEPCSAAFSQLLVETSSLECMVKCEPLSPPADTSELASKNGVSDPHSQAPSVAVSSNEVMSTSQTSSEASSVSQTTNQSTSVSQSTNQLTSVSQSSSQLKSVSESSNQLTSVSRSSNQVMSTSQTSSEVSSVSRSSNQVMCTSQTSSEVSSVSQTSDQLTSVAQSSNQSTSVSQSFSKLTSVSQLSTQSKSVSQTSSQSKSVSQTSSRSKSISQRSSQSKSVSEMSSQLKSVSQMSSQSKSVSKTSSQSRSVSQTSSQSKSVSQTSSQSRSVSKMSSQSKSVSQMSSQSRSVSQTSSLSKSVSQMSSQSKSVCQSSSQSKSVSQMSSQSKSVSQTSSQSKSICQSSSLSKSVSQTSSQSKSVSQTSSRSTSTSQSNSCGNGQSKDQENEGKGKKKKKSKKRKSETSHWSPAKRPAVHPSGSSGWADRTFTHTGWQGQDWSTLQGSVAGHSPYGQQNSLAHNSLVSRYSQQNSLAHNSLVSRYSQQNSLAHNSLVSRYSQQNSLAHNSLVSRYSQLNSLALSNLVGRYSQRNSLALSNLVGRISRLNNLALDNLVGRYSQLNSLALDNLVGGYSQLNSLALDNLVGGYSRQDSLALDNLVGGYSRQDSLASHRYSGNEPCWYLDSWPTNQDSFEGFSMPENPVPLDFVNTWTHYDCDQFVGARRRQASAGRCGYARYC